MLLSFIDSIVFSPFQIQINITILCKQGGKNEVIETKYLHINLNINKTDTNKTEICLYSRKTPSLNGFSHFHIFLSLIYFSCVYSHVQNQLSFLSAENVSHN